MKEKSKIHFVVRPEPIQQHGLNQLSACGLTIHAAQPVIIVPDAVVVSLGIIASQFGSKMCRDCMLIDPNEGYCYFMASQELADELRNRFAAMEEVS